MIWYALCVPRQKEFIAERLLGDDGFDVRVPIIHSNPRKIHRKAKRKVMNGCPHFPGWVFIGFNDDAPPEWHQVMRYSIIKGLMGRLGAPMIFSDSVMADLMLNFHQRPVRYSREVRKRYRSGELAEIISGPYQGRKVRIVPVPRKIAALIEVYVPEKQEAA